MKHLAALLAAGLPFAALPTWAADTYVTEIRGNEKNPASSVTFSGDCGEECYAATLSCGETGGVSFTFGDVEAKAAAAAMLRKDQSFAIRIGKKTFSATILRLEYGGEMYGTWLVTGDLPGTSMAPEFVAAIGKATSFKASIGGKSLVLPVNDDVKKWVAACGK